MEAQLSTPYIIYLKKLFSTLVEDKPPRHRGKVKNRGNYKLNCDGKSTHISGIVKRIPFEGLDYYFLFRITFETTEIALATYRESFFLNNPLLNRSNDYDGSPYFEFVV